MNLKFTKNVRWRWAFICGLLTAVFYSVSWIALVVFFLILTAVLSTIAVLSSRTHTIESGDSSDDPDDLQEEFTLSFPETDENGWHTFTVSPSKNTYEEEVCYGGPPTVKSLFRYSVKTDYVFAQLIDSREGDFNETHFEVVNGQVLESDIRARKPWEETEAEILRLKEEVMWTEVKGSLRYFILSLHGWSADKFSKELLRVEAAFIALSREATALGAIREARRPYLPAYDADEKTKQAIRDLQDRTHLERLGLSFFELIHYEHIVQTLNQLKA